MFFGYYERTLDEKGRLLIPSKMKDEAGIKVFIMKGFDGALSIYKASKFEELVKASETIPFNKKNSRAYLRIQLGSACELDVDRQGRIQLPTHLLNKYHIGKDVVVLGVGEHMEVWDRAAYEEYERNANESFEEIAENLEKDEF